MKSLLQNIYWKKSLLGSLCVIVFGLFLFAVSAFTSQLPANAFIFTAAGDYSGVSSGDPGGSVLTKVKSIAPDFHLALGDFSYNTDSATATSWDNNVKTILGSTFPFELIIGNHDSQNIDAYIAGLPHRLSSPVTGTYGKEYYFDYPATNPLARFIFVAPGGNVFGWTYTTGDAHYTWTQNAIKSAKSANIPWIIVSMHEDCIELGTKDCGATSGIGANLFNLLIGEKVDLILQGHDHVYNRSKQLALNTSTCTSISPGGFNSNCVTNQGPAYQKGNGSVVVINGTGGVSLYANTVSDDQELPYFAKWSGSDNSPSHGVVKYDVTATSLTANYLHCDTNSSCGTFTDSFSINASGTTPLPTAPLPSNTPTPTLGTTIAPSPTRTPTPSPTRTPTPTPGATSVPGTATPTPVTCPATPPTGIATTSVNLSAGTYRVWSRIMAPDTTSNSYWLQVDNQCAVNIGDSSSISPNTWTWVNYKNGSGSSFVDVTVTSGSHVIKMIGKEDKVRLDRVILMTDTSCTPTGTGDNCNVTASITPTTPPSPTSTQPSSTPTPVTGGTNLVLNNSFENSTISPWFFIVKTGAAGTNTLDTGTFSDGSKSLKADITTASSASPWLVQLQQPNLSLAQTSYTVSFYAKASTARSIQVVMQQTNTPFTTFSTQNINITSSWQQYSFTYTQPAAEPNAFIGFNVAGSTGQVWIDNVSVSSGSGVNPTAVPTKTLTPTPSPTQLTCNPTTAVFNPTGPTLSATLKSNSGSALTSLPVTWTHSSGPAFMSPTSSQTDSTGTARSSYTLAADLGVQGSDIVTATFAGNSQYTSATCQVQITYSSSSPVPTPTPTRVPTPLPTSTPVPPTATPQPLSIKLSVTLLLHGIGLAGDNVTPGVAGNMTPLTPQRSVTLQLINSSNVTVAQPTGLVVYSSSTGDFRGVIDGGTSLPNGTYQVKVKTPNYLSNQIGSFFSLTQGSTTTLPSKSLVVGDTNNDNLLNILDYNLLLDCYSVFEPAKNCDPTKQKSTDLNDDGKVNTTDTNLWQRELSVQSGI